jgi:hypothetical protein
MAADGQAYRQSARPAPGLAGHCPYFFFFGFFVSFFGLLSLATEFLPYVEIIPVLNVLPRSRRRKRPLPLPVVKVPNRMDDN